VIVRKRMTGTEAQRILVELARLYETDPGVTVQRLDDPTLALAGAQRQDLEQKLNAISPGWPIHVGIDASGGG
jgi:hypothetical protein